MEFEVRDAYSNRAAEYIDVLDSMESVHPSDRQLVTDWARPIDGVVIDAGCGPGQWADHLASNGSDVRGIDLTPTFVEHARRAYPDRRFDVGRLENLDASTGSIAGVLAWYSLIHHEPAAIRTPLEEFARVLRPGGSLLIGFFEGPVIEPFDHAVVTAYRWPVEVLSDLVRDAGFEVHETHTRTGVGRRAHGALLAVRGGVVTHPGSE